MDRAAWSRKIIPATEHHRRWTGRHGVERSYRRLNITGESQVKRRNTFTVDIFKLYAWVTRVIIVSVTGATTLPRVRRRLPTPAIQSPPPLDTCQAVPLASPIQDGKTISVISSVLLCSSSITPIAHHTHCPSHPLPITPIAHHTHCPSHPLPITAIAHHTHCPSHPLPITITPIAHHTHCPSHPLPITPIAHHTSSISHFSFPCFISCRR